MEFPYQLASASSGSQVLMLAEFTLLQSEVDQVSQYLQDHHWTVTAIHNHQFFESDYMSKHVSSFDFILDAVPAEHDINAYLQLLRRDGNMTLVGAPDKPHAVAAFSLIFKRRSLSGSNIGGMLKRRRCSTFVAKITSQLM
jgi:D-arabinose 1-dehydrogenase-like Zn-dependent alcohol dehydrogenase